MLVKGIGKLPEHAPRTFGFAPAVSSANNARAGIIPGAAALGAEANRGTITEPVHVVFQEAGVRTQIWKTVRTLALAFLLIAGLSSLVEDRGVPKGLKEGKHAFSCFPILSQRA